MLRGLNFPLFFHFLLSALLPRWVQHCPAHPGGAWCCPHPPCGHPRGGEPLLFLGCNPAPNNPPPRVRGAFRGRVAWMWGAVSAAEPPNPAQSGGNRLCHDKPWPLPAVNAAKPVWMSHQCRHQSPSLVGRHGEREAPRRGEWPRCRESLRSRRGLSGAAMGVPGEHLSRSTCLYPLLVWKWGGKGGEWFGVELLGDVRALGFGP